MKTEGTDKKEMTAKEKEAAKQDKRRYRLIYKVARKAVRFPLRKYQFQTDKLPKTDEPYIVMANHLTEADILVCAVGRRGLITGDMVKPGSVVIDVAMNRNVEGKLCGDCVYDEVAEKASYLTQFPAAWDP